MCKRGGIFAICFVVVTGRTAAPWCCLDAEGQFSTTSPVYSSSVLQLATYLAIDESSSQGRHNIYITHGRSILFAFTFRRFRKK